MNRLLGRDSMHLILVEPEIPQNTGNVARTCVMTGTRLHLVKPLGFSLSEKEVRRSGLDYWQYLDLEVHSSFDAFKQKYAAARMLYFTTRGDGYYHQYTYKDDDFLVFGSETRGLDQSILDQAAITLRVPMINQIPRSLNLGNTVALVLYEALRQQGFPGMQ